MQEKDIRGLLWLAAMFAGLVLMIPFVWLFHSLLQLLERINVTPVPWVRDLLGFAVAMSAPALTVAGVRRYLDRRYPAAVPDSSGLDGA